MRRLPGRFGAGAATAATSAPLPTRSAQPASGAQPGGAVERPGVAEPNRWPGRELLESPQLARILLAAWGGQPVVEAPACPGAGKSRLVALLAAALAHRAELRVAVASPTREQAAELARRITAVSDRCALVVSNSQKSVRGTQGVTTVQGRSVRWSRRSGGEILVGTTARFLFMDPSSAAADVLLVDEAWQVTYADLGALGALARQVVCVGDPGQVAPVVTGSTQRWDGNPTGPHLPAPEALRAAHGDAVTVYELTNSWRLGPRTCELVSQHFYPQMPFTSRRPDEAVVNDEGAALPEVVSRPVPARYGPTDPALLNAVAERVRELTWHHYRRGGGCEPLTGHDIAVAVPHVSQAGAVRALLAGVPGVLVGTINALQGLERPAVVALHPMAGYRTAEPFAMDPGRMCVALSRHRAHLTMITDPASDGVLDAGGDDTAAVRARKVLADLGTLTG